MTNSISLFEAKAHFSELVRQVAESGQGIAISVRGKPRVRLVPYDAPLAKPDAWDVREKLEGEYGMATSDAQDPAEQARTVVTPKPLFTEEDR
jgi:prevent-host-death family protein